MKINNTLGKTVGTFILGLVLATAAMAMDLDTAKSSGLVGELNSGYIAAVHSSAEVDRLVASINQQRKEYYQKIADKNGISLQAVEVRAGQKAIEKTRAGGLINVGEGWEKK